MKLAFYFNLICYIIVLFFFALEVVYGAMLQIPLGIIQLVCFCLLLNDKKEIKPTLQKLIRIYSYSLFIWLLSFILVANILDFSFTFGIFLFIIPMIIGAYFVLITFLIQKND